jgi:uncharacterized protein (TIGR02246 family)
MRKFVLLAGIALAACAPEAPKPAATEAPKPVVEAPKPPTEAEAIAVVNAMPPLVFAKDVPGIVGLYTDDAVLVDMGAPELITTKAANEAATKMMVGMDVSKMTINERHIQIIDADTFVSTMIATMDAKPGGKAESMSARVTDIYQKQAGGKWLVVNEHVSMMPAKPKAPLPVVESFAAPAAPATPAAAPAAAAAAAAAAPAATPVAGGISEADAAAFVDKLPQGLIAKDAAGMAALYTDNAVLVDFASPDLITTREANLKAITELVGSNITKATVHERKVQVLDADDFIVTEIVSIEMKPGAKAMTAVARVTDLVHKGADGKWLIVNEHFSAMPTAPKGKLPVVVSYPAAAAPAATPAAAATPAKPK